MAYTARQINAFNKDLNRGIALSLGTFEESLLAKFAEMASDANEMIMVFQAMGLEAFNRMKARTPVDTGFALSGWRIRSQRWSKDHVVIDIWNEVSYIVFLEYGWAKRAPLGMMRITLEEMGHRLRTGRGMARKTAQAREALQTLKANQGGWKSGPTPSKRRKSRASGKSYWAHRQGGKR